MHYRLKDATGLLLDGTYHVNCIKKGSNRTPLGIVDKFDTYETALKNTLLNKFAIETLNNKLQEIKGINALVDAKRASSFNNAIKLVNENDS